MKFEERELSIYIILRNALVDKRTRSVVAVVRVGVRVGLAKEVTAGASDLAGSRSAGRASDTVVRGRADVSRVSTVVDIGLSSEASLGVSGSVEDESRVATSRAGSRVGVADVVTVLNSGARDTTAGSSGSNTLSSISSSRGESVVASVSALSRDADGGTVGRGSSSSLLTDIVGSATNTGSGEGSLGLHEGGGLRVGVLLGSSGGGSTLSESLGGSGATSDTGRGVYITSLNNVAGDDTRVDGRGVDRGEREGGEREGDEAGLEGRHVWRVRRGWFLEREIRE